MTLRKSFMILSNLKNNRILRSVAVCLFCTAFLSGVSGSLVGCDSDATDDSTNYTANVTGDADEIRVYDAAPAVEILETEPETETEEKSGTDLIFFMGQSNMSGRGDVSLAPHVPEEAGMEFRAFSDPTTLYPLTEPFGRAENNPKGLCEKDVEDKCGSLVSAFVNEYHKLTGNKVIAVSVSMGGLAMDLWIADMFYSDVESRINTAKSYLESLGIVPEHTYVVWLQGESDTSREIPAEDYEANFRLFFDRVCSNGIDEVFVILPGMTSFTSSYTGIVDVQKDICAGDDRFCLATTVIRGLSDECFADAYHLNQHALNLVGTESAKAAAYYVLNGRKPVIYDYAIGENYVPSGSGDFVGECIEKISLDNVNEEF